MNKRKLKFNFVDVIIILIIVAAIFVLAKVFLGGESESIAETVSSKIQYVIELQDIDERFEDMIKSGQSVQDAIERKNIGTVVGVQAIPYEVITFDYTEGKEKVSVVEGKLSISVTIEAEAIETDSAFTVDGCVIRVGEKYSIVMPEMYGTGFCVKLTKVDNN